MGKEKSGFLTPKAIGNRIKSKGLQKLRWYCQMCQKQCRDENGFKCHCMSESHQRQLLLAGENPEAFNEFFSKEFLTDFMELLKRRFGTKRVHNNIVYNEYINHKEHIHMNSTKWETLGEFTKWLGREGYCKVDQTEKGWFIQYIDRDPKVIARQKELEKQKQKEKDDEERQARAIEEMVRKGQAHSSSSSTATEYTELCRANEDEKVAFNFSSNSNSVGATASNIPKSKVPFSSSSTKRSSSSLGSGAESKKSKKTKRSALDEIMATEETKKKTTKKSENWLAVGIVVKIITKRLGDKFFKKKGVITNVQDKFTATVKMLDGSKTIKLDQMHVETVIPAIGRTVMIVNGGYCGNSAILESIDVKTFSATVKINSGPLNGRLVDKIKYEDFSKKYDGDLLKTS